MKMNDLIEGNINNMDEYQGLASRTARLEEMYPKDNLANFALGLTGEAGEVADEIKKHVYHGHNLDIENLKGELGDVLWYLSMIAEVLELDLSEIAQKNIDKLRKRYPEGFSEEASKQRVDMNLSEGGKL